MPGLGPRVGGAHVDVNMKMDDRSIDQVGKQIHRQLSKLSDNLVQVGERNRKVYQEIGKDGVTAWRALLGVTVAGAPLMGSAISGVAGAATVLGGALYSVGQSSGALLPVVTSLGIAGLTASIGMRNFGAAVGEVDPKKLQQLLADMPKSMQAAVMSTRAMSKEMRAVIWEKMFVRIGPLMERLKETGVIQRGLGKMAVSLNGMAQSVLRYTTSAQGVSVLNQFFANNAKVFTALGKAVVPFLDGFLRLVNALTPAALRFANGLTDVGKRFQSWTQGVGFAKRIDDSMKQAQKTAGLLWSVLGNLSTAIMNVFNAANPATNVFLQMLIDVTQRFEDWTASVGGKNSIAEWAMQSVDVMRQFGKTLGAVFEVLGELADPRVIISFLKTVEGAFNILGKLPLESIVNAFVILAETLQPVSSMFLAIIIGGAALNILIGSMIGQVGGLFSVLAKLIKFKILVSLFKNMGGGTKAVGTAAGTAAGKTGLLSRAWAFLLRIITRVKSAFSGVLGFFTKTGATTGQAASNVGKLGSAFKPVMSILGRFAKFAGWVGIAVWIGTIIAKSKDLQAKFGEVWGAMKEVGSALSGAFKEIGEALSPLAPAAQAVGRAIGPVFDFLDKLVGLAIGVFLDMVIYGFKSLANVITGAGSIIAGLINVIMGLFTLDFGKVWDGLKQMASGVWPLLKGIFGLFVTFFAPARLAKLGLGLIKGLGSGIKAAAPGVLATIGRFALGFLKFFATLPFKLLGLGVRAITSLGGAIMRGAPKVLAAAGRIVTGVIGWVVRLPGRLLALGVRAVTSLGGAVARGAPRVLAAAGRIVTGVIGWIARLPGRLLALGARAVASLGQAVAKGSGKVSSAAGRVATAAINGLKKLPGRLLSLGKDAVGKLGGAISSGIGKARTAAGKIANAVMDAVKGLPGKLFSAGGTMISSLASGITSRLAAVGRAAAAVANKVKSLFPGSPVKEGPLKAWNVGSGASGGGRNIVDALARGLRDISPIEKAVGGIADSIAMAAQPPAPVRRRGASESRAVAAQSPGFPSTLILSIDGYEFQAFLEPVIDGRVAAMDSLSWQGA